jgi:hypothetical protein
VTVQTRQQPRSLNYLALGEGPTSYQNRTGKSVALYNWTGAEWQLLVNVPDGAKGDMPQSADNMTDAVKICA